MNACECGNQENEAHARFCSECGRPLGEQPGLLGVSQPKTLTTTATTKSSAVDWRWLAAALAVTVSLIAWSATSGGSNDESETAEDRPGSSTTVERSSTTASTTTAPATTTPPSTSPSPSDTEDGVDVIATVESFGDGGQLFDDLVGFRILASGGNRLISIDPDAGTVTRHGGSTSRAHPMAIVGDWLIVGDPSISRVPLGALASQPVNFTTDSEDRTTLAQPTGDDGTIWVQQNDISAAFPTFVRLDVESGGELDRIELEGLPARITTFSPPVGDRPMLVGVPAGGTYEVTARAFRRMTEAHLIAAGTDQVLVSSCDDRLDCTAQWLDRTTWTAVERPVPEESFDLAEVIDGTDWLTLTSFASGGSTLYNTASGASVDLRDQFFGGDWRQTMTISPDGRWMATRVGILIELTNLETGEERMIDGVPTDGRIIFTNADVGFGEESGGGE